MNETFSFPRFRTYFLYDLKQMWRRNSRAIILIGFASVIFYLMWVTLALVFGHSWNAPGLIPRAIVFYVAAFALVLYQTRTYGYLTERRAGSSWLMIPASTTEKFISMMLITVLVLPIAFSVVYLASDALIVLLDPTASDPLISSFSTVIDKYNNFMVNAGKSMGLSASIMILPVILQLFCDFLFFLLCGICFKRWKLAGAFAILIGLQFVLTSIIGIVAFNPHIEAWLTDIFADPDSVQQTFSALIAWCNVVNVLFILGLGTGIFFRIKNLKH